MSDSAAARVFAFIFVRGGSKGLPGKNLRKLGDRSLLAHSIAVARACRHIERTIVSTDDEDLAHEAEQHGAEVPFIRPASLAQDNSPEWLAWQHAIRAVESDPKFGPFQCFVSVPATAPLRAVQDVEACIDLLLGTDSDVVVTASKARHHPAFNMLRLDERGVASVYAPLDSVLSTRQSAPPAYDMTTVAYAAPALQSALELIDAVAARAPVDPRRIYASGFSMGGSTTLLALLARPDLFAAAMTMSAIAPSRSEAARLKTMPLLMLHGDADSENPIGSDREMVAAIHAAGGRQARLREYGGLKHQPPGDMLPGEWWRDWLFAQHRKP